MSDRSVGKLAVSFAGLAVPALPHELFGRTFARSVRNITSNPL